MFLIFFWEYIKKFYFFTVHCNAVLMTSQLIILDVEPPIIDCPDDIEVTASPFSSTTKVTWFVANASDNSNNVRDNLNTIIKRILLKLKRCV